MTVLRTRPVVVFIPPSCCGAGYFHRLRRSLDGRVDVHALELPGHGRRYREPLLTGAGDAVLDVTRQIADRIGGPVDAVYGESLGAYAGLAVAASLVQPRPPLLLAASNSPPSARGEIRIRDLGSPEAAIAVLTELGGVVPVEVSADPVLAGRVYPMVRGDLLLSRSFTEATRALSVTGDIGVLGGTEDAASTRLEGWAAHTTGRCEVVRLPGGHLLSADNPGGVAAEIVRMLSA